MSIGVHPSALFLEMTEHSLQHLDSPWIICKICDVKWKHTSD